MVKYWSKPQLVKASWSNSTGQTQLVKGHIGPTYQGAGLCPVKVEHTTLPVENGQKVPNAIVGQNFFLSP